MASIVHHLFQHLQLQHKKEDQLQKQLRQLQQQLLQLQLQHMQHQIDHQPPRLSHEDVIARDEIGGATPLAPQLEEGSSASTLKGLE